MPDEQLDSPNWGEMDYGQRLRLTLERLFWPGVGSLMLGPAGALGGMLVPGLTKPGGVFGGPAEEPDVPPPIPPTFDPRILEGGFGFDDPERIQQFIGGLDESLWDDIGMSLSQRTAMNEQSRQQFGDWQQMMQSAFTHAYQTMNQIPGIYSRGEGGLNQAPEPRARGGGGL